MPSRLPQLLRFIPLLLVSLALFLAAASAANAVAPVAPEVEDPPQITSAFGPSALAANKHIGVWLLETRSDTPPIIRAARASWVRIAINWATAETSPGVYNWNAADRKIQDAKAEGFDVVLAVMHNPTWAADYECGPIKAEHLSTFANFMAAVVQRYGSAPYNIRYFELGNEPDNGDAINQAWVGGCWGIGPNPAPGAGGAAYADMLKRVYPAMKTANSNALVAIGGLSYEYWTTEGGPYDPNFLNDLLAAGGGDYFDVINYHFYEAWTFKGGPRRQGQGDPGQGAGGHWRQQAPDGDRGGHPQPQAGWIARPQRLQRGGAGALRHQGPDTRHRYRHLSADLVSGCGSA
ncbi:MAG: cellulase family glycosylhydrolase [Caldilineales bacterium]|nr:cellulase family glycosylhydrolase [Caldilineales bacterium]